MYAAPDLNPDDIQKFLAGSGSLRATGNTVITADESVEFFGDLTVDTILNERTSSDTIMTVKGMARIGITRLDQKVYAARLEVWLKKYGMPRDIDTWLIVNAQPSDPTLRWYKQVLENDKNTVARENWANRDYTDIVAIAEVHGRMTIDTHHF